MGNIILKIILLVGLVLRVYLQFYTPCFNVDEISLGQNIKSRNFVELMYPLDHWQSSPPLYLLIQKTLVYTMIGPFWVKVKVFSFLVSTGVLYSAYKLSISIFKKDVLSILFLSLFCFNPFVIYHTLTLKQYGLDLFLLLVIYRYMYNGQHPPSLLFLIWSLGSNVGLFFTFSYFMLMFFSLVKKRVGLKAIFKGLLNKRSLIIVLGPVVYVLYFIWFMQQEGAHELKVFMQEYWINSFIPLNNGIVKYVAYFIHSLIVCFMSSYLYIGIFILLVGLIGLAWKYNQRLFNMRNTFLISGIMIHVLLNILHLYPLSQRLYLYLALPIYLIITAGIDEFIKRFPSKWWKICKYGVSVLLICSYFTYTPYRENDVVGLWKYLESRDCEAVIYSQRARINIDRFIDFTDGVFRAVPPKNFSEMNSGDLYVSRVHHKFGHSEKTSKEEPNTLELIMQGKLALIHKVDGFNIYLVQ